MIINQVVSGGGSRSTYYIEKTVDANGKLVPSNTLMNLNGFTDIGDYCLSNAYSHFVFPNDTSIVFGDLQQISGVSVCNSMFQSASGITSVSFPHLTTIIGMQALVYMFSSNANIISVDLDSLTTLSGSYCCQQMFSSCATITSVKMSSLTTVSGQNACYQMFMNCPALTEMSFESLESITASNIFGGIFQGCTNLSKLSFFALKSFGTQTNQFANMLRNVNGCTVHFPMAIQATIGSWSDVTNGFAGTNTTVLFDIVTSLTGADSNTYTRKQKESTATATAWTYNSTTYYTSGTTEPTVGATIYSDSACTNSVTTVSAIA